MECPASCEAISAFEELSGVCICICKSDSEGETRLGQKGRLEYLTNDLIYLFRIETASKSQYIYFENNEHVFNLQHVCHFWFCLALLGYAVAMAWP